MPGSSLTTTGSAGPGSVPSRTEPPLSGDEREALLAIARAAVRAAVEGRLAPPQPPDLPPRLQAPSGAFVSLHRGATLRGCIGSVLPEKSLAAVVAEAAAAATRDPRLLPVAAAELAELEVEVSVLSPTRAVPSEEIQPALHGVCLRLGDRRAVLLPQVAIREAWDRETLLARLCEKAGLPPGGWRDPAAVLLVFTAETVSAPLVGAEPSVAS